MGEGVENMATKTRGLMVAAGIGLPVVVVARPRAKARV